MFQGLYRDLTRPQAQRSLHPSQTRFDGGENSDSPASKIAPYELALAENVVPYRDELLGGFGAKLYSPCKMPGSGTYQSKQFQHPVSKRVLMHRGGKLWLSTTAACVAWTEVVPSGPGGLTSAAAVIDIDGTDYTFNFNLNGMTADNTDNFTLYWNAVVASPNITFNFYKDEAKTQLVATSTRPLGTAEHPYTAYVTSSGGSGIFGYFAHQDDIAGSDGTYTDSDPAVFTPINSDLFGFSKISAIGDQFLVANRTASSGRTLYVDQVSLKYWDLSTTAGYAQEPPDLPSPGGTPYAWRYLFTASRILNIGTGLPDFTKDRNTGSLVFEGPSNLKGTTNTDYATYQNNLPVEGGSPNGISLTREDELPFSYGFAQYLTHTSIYRTADVGENGIRIGNNPELYVWIADVPIYETTYSDTTDDETLIFRYGGDKNGLFTLKSRFFVEMSKGIAAVGTDFMFTAGIPVAPRVDYCSLDFPRLIGYHYNGTDGQFRRMDSPVEQIFRTARMFIICGNAFTTVCNPGVFIEPGNGIEFRPTIQDWDDVSRTIGLKTHHAWAFVDKNSFVGLCNDGTVRIFDGANWGDPLDAPGDDQDGTVHALTASAIDGACPAYIRKAIYLFYRIDTEPEGHDRALRYGQGGFAGSRWSRVTRTNWVQPPIGTGAERIVDLNGVERLIAISGEAMMAIEEPESLRQIVDDQVAVVGGLTGAAAAFISNMVLTGGTPGQHFNVNLTEASGTQVVVEVSNDDEELVASFMAPIASQPITAAAIAEEGGSGISGTADIAGYTAPVGVLSGDYYMPGVVVEEQTDIPCRLRPGEFTGARRNQTVTHEESHLFVQPLEGQSLPAGFRVTMRGYADGVAVAGAVVVNAPYNGDMQYRARVQGGRLQNQYETTTSGFRITSMDTRYASSDMVLPTGPSNTPEYDQQKDLVRANTQWLYKMLGMNRATAVAYTLVGTAPTLVADNAGRTRAMAFAGGGYTAAQAALSGDFTIMAWVKMVATANTTLISLAGTNAFLMKCGAAVDDLYVQVGAYTATFAGVLDSSEFRHVAVVRTSGVVRVYVDGVEVTPAPVANVQSIGGGLFATGTAACSLFDAMVKTIALSADSLAYYVDDIVTNQGKKVLR